MKDFECECREIWRMVYAAAFTDGHADHAAALRAADRAVADYRESWSS